MMGFALRCKTFPSGFGLNHSPGILPYFHNEGDINLNNTRRGVRSSNALLLQSFLVPLVNGANRARRVVGGDAITLGEWPWLVSLNFMEHHAYLELQGLKHLCGGTLVAPEWVLTAAHCVHFASGAGLGQPQNWKAVLGEYNRKVTETTEQVIGIESIHVHPGYSLKPKLTMDLALLRLERPATLNNYVKIIGMDTLRDLEPGHTCEAAGWGQHTPDEDDEHQYGNGTFVPHSVRVAYVPEERCEAAYSHLWPRIDDNVLCFVSDSRGDTCRGDSGGPLVCLGQKDEPVLTGIVSVGMGCALQEYPGIYTRAAVFRPWILQTISEYSGRDREVQDVLQEENMDPLLQHARQTAETEAVA